MRLSPKTRVAALLEAFPFLEEFLPSYNPNFAKLLNPVARKTIAKVATLQMAASNAGIELKTLLEDLRDAIRKETGEEVTIMSEKELAERAARLKDILKELHAGKDVDELKSRFAEEIADVSPAEIAAIEQELVKDGITPDQITKMCDLHVAIFRDSLDREDQPGMIPGHPVYTFKAENREFEKLARELNALSQGLDKKKFAERREVLERVVEKLRTVEIHYTRKENQLFPYLEKHGITAPPQVMWAVHDQIRDQLKAATADLKEARFREFAKKAPRLAGAVLDMMYKEENILFPMALEHLSEEEWLQVRKGEAEIGYALVKPGDEWKPEIGGKKTGEVSEKKVDSKGGAMELKDIAEAMAKNIRLPLDVGGLTLEQINLMLKHLPVDISFVDENDELRYYSDTPERIFPRSPGVIGRKVQNCHPPKSVHIVQKILDEFRAGNKDTAEFWIETNGKFIHIRYFAMRDAEGNYRGTLEVSQDVSEIRKLEGEKRLLDWKD